MAVRILMSSEAANKNQPKQDIRVCFEFPGSFRSSNFHESPFAVTGGCHNNWENVTDLFGCEDGQNGRNGRNLVLYDFFR